MNTKNTIKKFYQYCNQKLEDGKDCDLKFYMEFEEGEREALVKTIKSIVKTELDLKKLTQ